MRVKLTKASIDRLKAPTENAKQRLVWDSELVGFGILLSGTTASRTYVVQRNVRGKSVRVSVAPVNLMSLEQARTMASGLLVDMWNGINPKVERRAAKVRGMTLQQALDGYLASRKTLRATTAFEYQSSLKRYLGAWLNRPLAEIDPDMVEKRHEAIQKEIGERNIHKDGSIRNRLVTGGNAANGAMRSLRVVWNYAADKIPDLPPNPVKRLKKQWYPERRRDRVLRHDEMPIFWKALQGLEHLAQRDVNTLMLFTGMRRSEARPLLWTEADLTERVFR
ncbi:MAG: integrase arm-type DNA-binding domain-containing protein, partial [Dongiaceae bacterium]